MVQERSRRRKPADPPASRTVKTTVVLDVGTHARLAAAAALRGCDRSTYAADAIKTALAGIFIVNRRNSSGNDDPNSEVESAS